MKRSFKIFFAILMISLLSCKKDKTAQPTPDPVVIPTANMQLNFINKVDTMPLVFGQKYVNQNGDTFQVSKFNYFISNIVFTKSDNTTYSDPNVCHVFRHSTPSSSVITMPVPLGSYKSVSFMLGVDSARNVSGAQTGELDPARSGDMYWDWNSGYIFLKFEGTSPQSGSSNKGLTIHIGGYGGVNKAQRNFKFDLSSNAEVRTGGLPTLQFAVDLNELFRSPNKINFATQNTQTSAGPGAKIYADNYADMIKFFKLSN